MKRWLLCILLLHAVVAQAGGGPVLHWQRQGDLETTYVRIYRALEERGFFVVFEPDIGANLAGFAERWGADYNRNGLQGIRAMVFCNAWYANQVGNLDPELLALCPLHLTLYEQDAVTHVLFVSPAFVGKGSAAADLLRELEADVSKAVQQGLAVEQGT